jgi:hypothetical protein
MWHEIREEAGRVTFEFETEMKITVAFDQEWYLNTYPTFHKYPETMTDFNFDTPADINIKTRVRTIDIISGSEVYDIIDLKVASNNREWSDFCATDFGTLAVDSNTVMSGDRTWDVPKSGTAKEAKNILITSKVPGLEDLEWRCREQLWMSIDIEMQTDVWVPIFSERDPAAYSDLMGLFVMHDGAFYNLVVEIDEFAYINDWKVFFPPQTADNKVTVKARVAYNTGNGPVTQLTQTINIVINGNDEEDTGCSTKTALLDSVIPTKDLAFEVDFAATGTISTSKITID